MKIVCAADIHLRSDKPSCRKESEEEWINVQMNKLLFMISYAQENDALVILAGDVCHRATGWPSWFFVRVMETLSDTGIELVAIPGQHDMPYHQFENIRKSNLGVLYESCFIQNVSKKWFNIAYFPWGEDIEERSMANIAVAHIMTIEGEDKELFPGQLQKGGAFTAKKLLQDFPNYELIITGDNHKSFTIEYEGRTLVNPGSMTRQRTNETHEPGFYVYDTNSYTVKRITFPHEKDVFVYNSGKEMLAQWGGNAEAVKQLLEEMENGEELNFRTALEAYFVKHKTRADVQKKILGA